MKTKKIFKRFATGMLFCASILLFLAFIKKKAEQEDEDHTHENENLKDTNITITVDTENINEENKLKMVVFSDDRGDSTQAPGDPTNYISTVSRNKKVYWKTVLKNSSSTKTVEVHEVYLKQNQDADIVDSLYKSKIKKGVYVGKIKNKKSPGTQGYNVVVNILEGDSIVGSYDVDPKLKMAF